MIRMELHLDRDQAKALYDEGFDALRPDLLQFAEWAANDFRERIVHLLNTPIFEAGKSYWIKGVKRFASRPGDAPLSQTGDYAKSFETDTRSLKRSVQGRVAPAGMGFIAWILEFGSKFMRPRPHIRPVFFQWRSQLDREISKVSR